MMENSRSVDNRGRERGGGDKWLDSGHILKIALAGFVHELDWGFEKE